MMTTTRKEHKPISPHPNFDLAYDHFGAELFATFYAASVQEKPLRNFQTEEWLDLVRILYTLWQRGTGYEQALGDIGVLAKYESKRRRTRKAAQKRSPKRGR